MLRKIIAVLMVLFALVMALPACASPAPNANPAPKLTPDEVELRYDDGTSDGRQGLGGPGYGYAVEFLPPSVPLTINKVRIFGELVGSGYTDLTFDVLVWDKEGKELYSGSFPHTEFNVSPSWTEVEIPEVVVNDSFHIVVITNTPRESGVYLYFDSSAKNEHSNVVQDWEIKDWYLKVSKERTNWMIRVVGTIEK